MKTTLGIMAAGLGSRYGGNKQTDGVGPNGEILMEYGVYDAVRAGFDKIVFIIKPDMLELMKRLCGDMASRLRTPEGQPVEVCYAFQDFFSLPDFYRIPEGRTKPFGTAHAVLCTREFVHEPFCVINCDDFYNRDTFMVIGKYLSELPEGSKNRYAMVGFRVGNTLSENGTVSRGICTTDAEGNLATVVERTKIERRDGAVQYKDDDDQWVTTPDNTPVSMNVWGFTPDYFDYSEDYFKTFLSDPENMANLKAEFFIPLMVNKLINDGTAAVKVLDTTSHWFGVTYPADRQGVVDRIQRLVDEGVYPAKLF